MRSPLPDSSNLEAGIVEDARPSRLSRVHDNVRDLLRRSVFGSVTSTPVTSPTRSPEDRAIPTPPIHPITQHASQRAMPINSPVASTTSSPEIVPGVLFPAWRQQPSTPPVVNNESQTPTPRDHPDLSQNTMSLFLQQKELERHQQRQHKAWKRPRSRKSRKSVSSMQWIICMLLGFAVLGLLGTCKRKPATPIFHTINTDKLEDIALVTTSSNVSAMLHVMFILALLLTSIVLVHTLVRLCCLGARRTNKRIVRIEPAPRRRHHRRLQEAPEIPPTTTTTTNASVHYVPPTPIPVQSHDFAPSDAPNVPEMCQVGDKGFPVTNPPPAYGSTTSSVRADPELLFWHAIPSPVEDSMPSPTYAEVMREDVADRRTVDGERPQG